MSTGERSTLVGEAHLSDADDRRRLRYIPAILGPGRYQDSIMRFRFLCDGADKEPASPRRKQVRFLRSPRGHTLLTGGLRTEGPRPLGREHIPYAVTNHNRRRYRNVRQACGGEELFLRSGDAVFITGKGRRRRPSVSARVARWRKT